MQEKSVMIEIIRIEMDVVVVVMMKIQMVATETVDETEESYMFQTMVMNLYVHGLTHHLFS